MRYLTLFCLILAFSALTAQEERIELDFREFKIDPAVIPFPYLKVIDATNTNGEIGLGHKGLLNKQLPIYVAGGIELAVDRLFQNQQAADEEVPAAIFGITGLRVGEVITGSSETRRIELETELVIPNGDGTFRVIGPHRIVELQTGLGDVTKGHVREITEVLERSLRLHTATLRSKKTFPNKTEAEALATKLTYPVQQAKSGKLPNGVYQSFFDYRAQQPDTNLVFDVAEPAEIFSRNDTAWYAAPLDKPDGIKNREIKGIFGCHHNGKDYFRLGGEFFEIKKTTGGKLVAAIPKSVYKAEISGAQIAATVMFGVMGALLVPDGNADVSPHVFDPRTGRFVPEKINYQTVAGRLMLNSSLFSDRKLSLNVRLPDGTKWQLAPGEFIFLGLGGEVCYDINGGKEKCEAVKLHPKGDLTLWTINVKNEKKADFFWASDDEAETAFGKAKAGELKEGSRL